MRHRGLDYETSGCSMYGAQMGRRSDLLESTSAKLHLRRVPPRDGGDYDPGGAYWGGLRSAPLWCAWNDAGQVRYVRAPDRDAAKAHFPNAKFWR